MRSVSRRQRTERTRTSAALAGTLIAIFAAWLPSVASAGEEPGDGSQDEIELAERYAPIVVVKAQDGPCDRGGEPFEPAPVEIVLDNPEVFLRQVGNDDPVAMRGPSATDLFDLREGWYLDFPGDALEPGCVFEQDFRRFFDGRSVVYAHVATEAGRPGLLALQYWFFWYHNPAKNDHEGDWEFVQLLFEADDAAEALAGAPIAAGYAQHTGGERASWDDAKLERVGDRPVVYAARGSHASYFGSALYLGRSSREGFGCDDTSGPSRRLEPDVVLLPHEVTDASDPLAWLSFQGRWGQRETGFFNGPTGPFAKARWSEPVAWHEGLRSSSVVIPGGDRVGDGVVGAFCQSVEVGSSALSRTLRSPMLAVLLAVSTVVVVVGGVRATRWSPVVLAPLRSERALGQILRASWRVWVRSPGAMTSIGLVYVPVAIITSAAQAGVMAVPFIDDVVDVAGDRSGVSFVLAMMVGGLADLLALVFVVAAVARVLDGGHAHGSRWGIFPTRDELVGLFGAVARAIVIVGALLVSVVGIPWGLRQLVRYQFVPQAVVLEGRRGPAALARSSELVRGRWWKTAGIVLGVEAVILVVGFTAAVTVLLMARTLPLWAFNLVSALIYIVLVPIGAAALTYVYGSLATRADAPADAPAVAETVG